MKIHSGQLAQGNFSFAIASDKGRRRENEDYWLVDESTGLIVMADGLGGLPAGKVASKLVCQTFKEALVEGQSLEEAAWTTNELLSRESLRLGHLRTMGSTVLALQWQPSGFSLLWVGDSFAMTFFDGKLRSISRDHSEVSKLLEQKTVTSLEEARLHASRFLLTQALGPTSNLHLIPGINSGKLLYGERILLATDGLLEAFQPKELSRFMDSERTVEQAVEDLMWLARARMVHDNMTLAVGCWRGDDGLADDRFAERGYWSSE